MLPENVQLPRGVQTNDLFLAILHATKFAGIFKRSVLEEVLGEAAEEYGGMFEPFRLHPQYKYSKLVENLVSQAAQGSIIRYMGPDFLLQCAPALLHGYGRTKFVMFTPAQKQLIESIASKIVAQTKPRAA